MGLEKHIRASNKGFWERKICTQTYLAPCTFGRRLAILTSDFYVVWFLVIKRV